MTPNLKKFIETYIHLIDSENYAELYENFETSGLAESTRDLTNVLLDIDIPINDILNEF